MSLNSHEHAELISVDWGTTNLRAYALAKNGTQIDRRVSDQGLLSNPHDYAQCLKALIDGWLDPQRPINIVLSGMVGSPSGWRDVPHLPSPASLQQLTASTLKVAQIENSAVWIVPGVKGNGASGLPDIMRGEEVQFFGARSLRADQQLQVPEVWCFPGTHNKWIQEAEVIEHFSTAMVGELFELTQQHSLLAQSLESGANSNMAAFTRGLLASGRPGGLLHHLFSVRTLQLTGQQEKQDGLDYLSGLIIGHDISAQLTDSQVCVGIVAALPLARRYQRALEVMGQKSIVIDSRAATIAGALAINALLPTI